MTTTAEERERLKAMRETYSDADLPEAIAIQVSRDKSFNQKQLTDVAVVATRFIKTVGADVAPELAHALRLAGWLPPNGNGRDMPEGA